MSRWRWQLPPWFSPSVLCAVAASGFTFFPSPEAENVTASIFFHAGLPEDDAIAGIFRIEDALKQAEAGLTAENGETLVVASYATLGQAGNNRGDNIASINVQLSLSEERSVRTPQIVRSMAGGAAGYSRRGANSRCRAPRRTAGTRS